MKWEEYRNAVDRLPFSADFQARTQEALRTCIQEEKEYTMKSHILRKVLLTAAAVTLLTVTALAAARLLTMDQVAGLLEQPLLAEAFKSEDAVLLDESVETGDYRVTLVGLVSGLGLDSLNEDLDETHTYAVLALEKLAGEPLSDETLTQFTMTPLVSGYTPWSVNLWSLNSAACSIDQDGVHYRLLDIQDLELFADRTVYLAFYEGGSPSREIFGMDDQGNIHFQKDFAGPKALFTLPLDPSKADPAAAQALVESTGLAYVYDPDPEDTPLTVRRSADGTSLEVLPGGEPVWFTAETYAAYMAEETGRLRQQVQDGTLSQKSFDKSVADMEAVLAGLRDGTAQAAQVGENGVGAFFKGETDHDVTMTPAKDGVEMVIR